MAFTAVVVPTLGRRDVTYPNEPRTRTPQEVASLDALCRSSNARINLHHAGLQCLTNVYAAPKCHDVFLSANQEQHGPTAVVVFHASRRPYNITWRRWGVCLANGWPAFPACLHLHGAPRRHRQQASTSTHGSSRAPAGVSPVVALRRGCMRVQTYQRCASCVAVRSARATVTSPHQPT